MITDETQTWLGRVRDWGWEYGIGFLGSDKFGRESVCHAVPSLRLVIINTNYRDQQQLPFQVAHEVGHIMNGDTGESAFSFSKAQAEGRANRFAIKLLVPWFYDEVEEYDASSRWFTETFHLPDTMQDWVDEAVVGYYTGSI